MNRILSANLFRMVRSYIFWVCGLFVLCLSFLNLYSGIRTASLTEVMGGYVRVDDTIFTLAPYLGGVLAVFISLFIGEDYSGKTIRNKIITGNTRTSVYIAGWLTCIIAGTFYIFLWIVIQLPGFFFISSLYMSWSDFMWYILLAFIMMISWCSIFVLISMNTASKSLSLIINLGIYLIMTGVAANLLDRLNSPETLGGVAYMDGEFVMVDPIPNPYHPVGWIKTLFEMIYLLLPSGLAISQARVEIADPGISLIVQVILSFVLLGCGIFWFQRKNIQ